MKPTKDIGLVAFPIDFEAVDSLPSGRISLFLENWHCITKEPEVLSMVQGYEVDFTTLPHQRFLPFTISFSDRDFKILSDEVTSMLNKGKEHFCLLLKTKLNF